MILLSNDLDFVGIIIIALILLFFLALLLWVLWIIFKTIFGGTVKFLFNSFKEFKYRWLRRKDNQLSFEDKKAGFLENRRKNTSDK